MLLVVEASGQLVSLVAYEGLCSQYFMFFEIRADQYEVFGANANTDIREQHNFDIRYILQYYICRGFPNFSACNPQNISARDWGPPSTLEVACNVHGSTHALFGLCKHRHHYNPKEQLSYSHNIILK